MSDQRRTRRWLEEALRNQGEDPAEFRELTEALDALYASKPPGLAQAESLEIPRLEPVLRARRLRWAMGRRSWMTLGVAALLLIGFFAFGPRPGRVRDSGRQLALPLGSHVRGLATRGSVLGGLTAERAELASGSAWFWVTPGGKGFLVATPLGEVRVTGTCFGVTVENGTLRVDVTEGTVKVAVGDTTASVTAGESLVAAGGELPVVSSRSLGTDLPPWVAEELAEQEKSWVGGVLPSVGVHQR